MPMPRPEQAPTTAPAPAARLQYPPPPAPPADNSVPPPPLPQHVQSLATQAAVARGPTQPAVWFEHDFSDWQRLLQSVQRQPGQQQITSSWLFMPLIADALLPAHSAQAAFPFQRPPDWNQLTGPLRTGCTTHGITAERVPLDGPWHTTATWQEYVLNTALSLELIETLAALAASCQSGGGWVGVQATLAAQQEAMMA